jgi:glycosyltransferase involved in cell wall biosynthesis
MSLYRKALALVYVSFFGPENLPPLEAFAIGCPVIASQVHGAEEQLGDAALVVDPRSPEEISKAIQRVASDAQLKSRLIARGTERARRWPDADYIRGVWSIVDEFEPLRRCWKGSPLAMSRTIG